MCHASGLGIDRPAQYPHTGCGKRDPSVGAFAKSRSLSRTNMSTPRTVPSSRNIWRPRPLATAALVSMLPSVVVGASEPASPASPVVGVHPAPAPGRVLGRTSAPAADDSVRLTNTLTQAVNVYAVTRAGEVFVGRVEAGASAAFTVRGTRPGEQLQARATTVSGSQSYTREALVVGSADGWRIP